MSRIAFENNVTRVPLARDHVTHTWWLTNAATSHVLATCQSDVFRPDPELTHVNDNLSIKFSKLCNTQMLHSHVCYHSFPSHP